MRRGWLPLVALATTAAGCLLYTDRINHPPALTLGGETTVDRGATVSYDAQASDEDQDAGSIVLEWRKQPIIDMDIGDDPCPPAVAGPPAQRGFAADSARFTFTAPAEPGAVCVWVVARDDAGAESVQAKKVQATNRAPEAVIEVVKAKMGAGTMFALYNPVQLSGARSKDPDNDKTTFTWLVTPPGGEPRKPDDCPGVAADAGDACLLLDRPGSYQFALTVNDTFGGTATATKTLVVAEDQPPCIVTTMPDFAATTLPIPQKFDRPLRFELDVADDDGDPYPEAAERASMTWEWRFDDDAHPTRQVRFYPFLDFTPMALAAHVGHLLTVWLTYEDRVPRLLECDPAKPLCELPRSQPDHPCYQRVGWTMEIY